MGSKRSIFKIQLSIGHMGSSNEMRIGQFFGFTLFMKRSNDGDNNYVIREQLADIQNKNVRGVGGLSLNST